MRFVCKQWNRIIHDPTFIREHLARASYLLFARPRSASYEAHYIDVDERNATITPLDLQLPSIDVLDYCDGLMVFRGSKDEDIIYYVANPVTKQGIILPPLPLSSNAPSPLFPLGTKSLSIRLVPITSAEEYKVVCIYVGCGSARIFVVPLGKDVKWKELQSQQLSTTPVNRFFPSTVAAKGYIHWTYYGNNTSILCLDLEIEALHEVPAPLRHRRDVTLSYREIKNELCCVYTIDFCSFGVLLLTDPKSGAWTMLYEVEGIPWPMVPVAWVRDRDIIVLFDNEMSFTVYNVKDKVQLRI